MLVVTQAKCKDLLLVLLEHQLVVITHPDIFLDGFILSRRYIYRTIVTICENFRKLLCITAISLDFM